jgi:hypothetical protein
MVALSGMRTGLEHLLHPEAGERGIQESQNLQVRLFVRALAQLHNGCRPAENAAASVEAEVVVRSYERKANRKRPSQAISVQFPDVEPTQPLSFDRLAEEFAIAQNGSVRPQVTNHRGPRLGRNPVVVVRPDDEQAMARRPVALLVSQSQRSRRLDRPACGILGADKEHLVSASDARKPDFGQLAEGP